MSTTRAARYTGPSAPKSPPDDRSWGQRDRDRILYSDHFRRLGGVTQVAEAGETGPFHNRLTHSLEVAQLARRIAERLLRSTPDLRDVIDPDAVEAGALAHDLGHPPFGHAAEEKLDELVKVKGCADGFEGNAQSFRIVTKLARRRGDQPGLDLARGTLQSLTKYPWRRHTGGKESRKFGAYHPEREIFEWSREGLDGSAANSKTVEADIMDWADDVAYALHDVEDFFRAGIIPVDRIASWASRELDYFLDATFQRWRAQGRPHDESRLKSVAQDLQNFFPYEPWSTWDGRSRMQQFVGEKINEYVGALRVEGGRIVEDGLARDEIELLKSLTWTYVIDAPALSAQQAGQTRIIEDLFAYYLDATRHRVQALPLWAQRYLEDQALLGMHESRKMARVRVACDIVASLTERQAVALHGRIMGVAAGSIHEAINP